MLTTGNLQRQRGPRCGFRGSRPGGLPGDADAHVAGVLHVDLEVALVLHHRDLRDTIMAYFLFKIQ